MRAPLPTIALLHAVPNLRAPPPFNSLAPLYDFSNTATVDAWERIDDVIMGGVSSSRLVPESSSTLFEGRLRSEGGGFCGQRMKLLAEPIDLSSADGIYVDCEVLDVGAAPSKRVWKMAIRTRQDRGEVVYQQAFNPSKQRQAVKLPYDKFRLVRGPRLVPGIPPLDAASTNETYQISLVVSKFEVSETGQALDGFEEGLFAMRLHGIGTYAGTASSAAAKTKPPASMPRALTKEEQEKAAPPVIKLLRPLLGLLFGEETRRRRAATKLVEARGTSKWQRVKLGFAWRGANRGKPLVAARTTAALGLRSATGLALSLPIRLLFKLIFTTRRFVKAVMIKLGKGEKDPRAIAAAKVPLQ